MFSFSYDPDRVLLTITRSGYWTLQIFRDFEREFLGYHYKIRTQHRSYRVLSDCRDYPVQSQEIGEAVATSSGNILSENKGHYAIVTNSMLSTLQARRALPQDNVRIFPDMDEAMIWLFEEGSLPE